MKNFHQGKNINQGSYKSFQPSYINRHWTVNDMELLNLLSQADRQLGRLDMHSEYIPNIELFISMHIAKEATKSNKIEGTKTNMEEALLEKDDVQEEKRDDWEEVQNYISALNNAVKQLNKLPFSSRLIREAHGLLLKGVRGKHKKPGEYRSSQNWIGGAGISDATFIPPISSSINEYMNDLEKFAHNSSIHLPHLLKVALLHYQFETIHPFLDGNGRVGRLLITLYLVEKQILKKPILYLSDFFEKNRSLYYENLTNVREKGDLLQWFKFFLVGVIETSKSSIKTFDGIQKLRIEVEEKTQKLKGKYVNAQKIMHLLYQKPIINANRGAELTGLTRQTVASLLKDLEKLELVKETSGLKRSKRYAFEKYLNLFAD